MKKKVLLLSCLFAAGVMQAQEQNPIGIGIPLPAPSAILHIEAPDKGVLIPNVVLENLKSKAPVTSEIKESLLVYNKQEKKEDGTGKLLIAKGYYYWLATDATTGKWVRVITSEDADEILKDQVQEYFKETTTERDMPKLDANGKIVRDEKGNVITEKREVGGTFIYVADKERVNDDTFKERLTIDIPSLVKEQETVTTFGLDQYTLYHYADGTKSRDKLDDVEVIKSTTEIEIVYTDEKGEVNKFAVRDLLGSDQEDVLAITNLQVNGSATGLTFTNDKGKDVNVELGTVVKRLEALTSVDVTDKGDLIYVDENGKQNKFSLRALVKEPWKVAETGSEATKNTDNIFLDGWVGVGLDASEAAAAIANLKPDEKLRVNGSIYARNSYYADYVFENYFTKEASSLKYDYNFKDLSTVESFIKSNYHLPGITPVADLEKSSEEGYLINVSELSIQLLEKVEELYLHTIDQHKVIQQQAEQLELQAKQFEQQESRLRQIEAFINNSK